MIKTNRVIGSAIAMAIVILLIPALVIPSVTAQQTGLTGNWVVRTPRGDGTDRTTYFNLKQEGSRITGTIRGTQFYYVITESTDGPEGFTLVGAMKDGKSDRRVQYEG